MRLYQGDYGRETVYGDDPVAQARAFAAAGAPWIHVVDLDAARTGDPRNRAVVAAIAAAVDVPVQAGGGVRDDAAADALLDAGVRRVVVGHGRPRRPRRGCGGWPPATPAGWRSASTPGAATWPCGAGSRGRAATSSTWPASFDDAGVAALVVTEIGRDGTLEGPGARPARGRAGGHDGSTWWPPAASARSTTCGRSPRSTSAAAAWPASSWAGPSTRARSRLADAVEVTRRCVASG